MTEDRDARSFYVVAFAVGVAFSALMVSMPLVAIEIGSSAAAVGVLISAGTFGVAVCSFLASGLSSRLGPRNTLVAAIIVIAAGEASLLAPIGAAGLAVSSVVVGAGIGLFGTASMAMMATSAGGPRSASGFVTHYVCFIAGTAAGALADARAGNAEHRDLKARAERILNAVRVRPPGPRSSQPGPLRGGAETSLQVGSAVSLRRHSRRCMTYASGQQRRRPLQWA